MEAESVSYYDAVYVMRQTAEWLDEKHGQPKKWHSFKELRKLCLEIQAYSVTQRNWALADICQTLLDGPPSDEHGGGGAQGEESSATTFGKIIPFPG